MGKKKRKIIGRGSKSVDTHDIYADFECTMCGDCCKYWSVWVDKTAYEHAAAFLRAPSSPLQADPAEVFEIIDETPKRFARIRHRDDGACFFLQDDNSCNWHRHVGHDTMGWVCQHYPRISYTTPSGPSVVASLGCRPMAERLVAASKWPYTLKKKRSSFTDSALKHNVWTLGGKYGVEFDGRWLKADALDTLRDILIEFVNARHFPLHDRLMAGRLWLESLKNSKAEGGIFTKKDLLNHKQKHGLPDATALINEAALMSGDMNTFAHLLRTFVKVRTDMGVAKWKIDEMEGLLGALQMRKPLELLQVHLQRAHIENLLPQWHVVEPVFDAYVSHRLARQHLTVRSGIIAGYHDVLISYLLLWAHTLSAALQGEPLNDEVVARCISQVETSFFHVQDFYDFWKLDSGNKQTLSVAFAQVLTRSLESAPVALRARSQAQAAF